MGTRGFVTLVVDGVEHTVYNHMSSNPEHLGACVLADLGEILGTESVHGLRDRVRNLVDLNGTSPRVAAERHPAIRPYLHQVAEQDWDSDDYDWHYLIGFDGLVEWLDLGLYESHTEFPLNSGAAEWGYVIDLDAAAENPDTPPGVLEVYRGSQVTRPSEGRWANRPTPDEEAQWHAEHVSWCAANDRQPWLPKIPKFKAVQRIATWSLADLPTVEELLHATVTTTPAH